MRGSASIAAEGLENDLSASRSWTVAATTRRRLTEPTQTPSGSLSWILDAVQEGILVIDPLGGVRLANAAARKSLLSLAESGDGRQIRRLGGRPLPEILARAQGVRPLELSTAGSNPRTFDLRAIPAGAGPGNLGLTLLRIRDVTEERNLSRRSSHQERLAAVGQLAAGIAHDFNNIMAAIVLYSDMLRGEPGLSAQSDRAPRRGLPPGATRRRAYPANPGFQSPGSPGPSPARARALHGRASGPPGPNAPGDDPSDH